MGFGMSSRIVGIVLMSLFVLAGCAAKRGPAPIEDRGTMSRSTGAAPTASETDKPLPGAENLGKPGYYAVRPGDTIMRIGSESGQNWRDIARWNNLENPNVIEVGQVLRVIPPVAGAPSVAASSTGPAGSSGNGAVVSKPVTSSSIGPAGGSPAASGSGSAVAASTSGSPTPATLPLPPTTTASKTALPAAVAPGATGAGASGASGDEDVGWIWPAKGPLVAGFDDAKNKGLDIAGKAGDPVLAAADGKVVYSGQGLRGYGNLIILKHNNTYLTAYAHNQKLLVKEDQSVRKGQKIAEMGASDADRVKLHFEIRRQGKPVDPARYLPAH